MKNFLMEELIMFKVKTNRYITKGVQAEIPHSLINFCWNKIDKAITNEEIELDYLQVFEFERNDEQELKVIHRQEEPVLKLMYRLPMTPENEKLTAKKIWVIDDGTNQTMLLPSDY